MKLVNTHEAKSKLSQLLSEVELNKSRVRICRNGKPIADLVPVQSSKDPLLQHADLSVKIIEDPSLPLSTDEWPEEYR